MINKFIKWNLEKRGTNLITYATITVFVNYFFISVENYNKLFNIVHFLGFSLGTFGIFTKSLFFLSIKDESIFQLIIVRFLLIFFSILSFLSSVIFLLKTISYI